MNSNNYIMPHIAIPIPTIPGKQDIEIQVTINGSKQQLHYRVEMFYWSDCDMSPMDRVACIQQMLSKYDEDWMLYYIGAPTEDFVPITFVKKEDWKRQKSMRDMVPIPSEGN
jgi:hypothetical protein